MSSEEAKLQQLTTILGALRACYPQRVSDEEWLVTLRRYRAELRRFDAMVVYRACEQAWKKHAQWFPSLGQIVDICEAEQKSADCVKPVPPSRQLGTGAWPDDAKQRFAEIMAVLETKAEERGDR
jgi:hypothetical protein